MTIKIAINGFGRIGRCLSRLAFQDNFANRCLGYEDGFDAKWQEPIELVAINGTMSLEMAVHLLRFDSIHGRFEKEVKIVDGDMMINGKKVKMLNERDPAKLDWASLGVDVVMECTGAFTNLAGAAQHINSGARKVIISSPAKEGEPIKTIIFGVNDQIINQEDVVISVGSCTTNCLAPIAKILNDNIGIKKGFMTTTHAYTNDQNIVDGSHKDLRRARAAAMSMIPTSTGAAKAIGLVLPELMGKLDGGAIRVPTANVSMLELNFLAGKNTNKEEVNQIINQAILASKKTARVLEFVQEPLVSIDFNHSQFSSCFDATQTKVIGGDMVKICSWYDNEWGFSNRMLDVARILN